MELTHDELLSVVKNLARVVVLNRVETEALGVALGAAGLVSLAARQHALERYSELSSLIDEGTPETLSQVFEKILPNM
jgi:ABC-type Fe3+-hydroxamate transport system substrate-binding protein